MPRIVLTGLLSISIFVLLSCVSLRNTTDGNVIEYNEDKAFMARIAARTVKVVVPCVPVPSNDYDYLQIKVPFIVGGTGVILRSFKHISYIFTARHVVVHDGYICTPVIYLSSDGKRKNTIVAKVLVSSEEDDLSLISVPVNLKISTYITKSAYIGQKLIVSGYPGISVKVNGTNSKHQSVSINSGEYATDIYGKNGDLFLFRMTCDVWSGYSGGAVFDVKGAIVGITSFMVAIPVSVGAKIYLVPRPGFFFARPYNKIRKLLIENDYKNLMEK